MKNFNERVKYSIQDYNLPWSSEFFVPDDFDKIENRMGIYSWHLMPARYVDEISIFNYMNLYKDNIISIEGRSNFASYNGKIEQSIVNDDAKIKTIFEDENAVKNLIIATALFSPSLYIGISKNLKSRISQHHKILSELYHNSSNANFEGMLGSNTEEAELVEARNFGERISELFKKEGSNAFTVNCFCVKVLYFDSFSNTDRAKLEAIEYVLNRSYKPKFGKN